MAWFISYSSRERQGYVKRLHGLDNRVYLNEHPGSGEQFDTREAAAAWVLHYLDARIVDKASDLSTLEPTCFIHEIG